MAADRQRETIATTTVTTTTSRRHGTSTASAAIDLVAQAYLAYRVDWIASRLDCRLTDGVGVITLNGHKVHVGSVDALDRVRAELPARLAATVDVDDPMMAQGGYLFEGVKRVTDFWKQPGPRARDWLEASLCDGDDAAHFALEIAALVGDPRWQSYADTSTNVRTGVALPQTLCLVAGARNTRYDLFLQDWDTLTIRQVLDRASQSCQRDVAETRRCRRPVVRHGGLCAVEVGPGEWDLSRGPSAKSARLPPVDADCMAQMLACARLAGRHHGEVSLHVGGRMYACLQAAGKHVSISLAQTSLDRDPERTRAVLSAARLTSDPRRNDFEEMAYVVRKADAMRDVSETLDAQGVPDGSWLAGLRQALHREDSSHLRLSVGAVWDAAKPSSAIECASVSFVADAYGTWRDPFGAAASWDDLVRAAHAKRRLGRPYVVLMPGGHIVDVTLTRTDPCVAPDFAYRLCCEALAGDPGAVDWLGVLALASPAWAMLDTTVCRVLSWVKDGAPATASSPESGSLWREPLIDWILDVAPGDDAGARFAVAEAEYKNKLAFASTDAADQTTDHACDCDRPGETDRATGCDGMCAQRRRTVVSGATGGTRPFPKKIAYMDAVTELLARTPLDIDGRQILAADAFCPFLGETGRGVEALVRALYTCEPLRTKVLDPAQLALAERVLAAASPQ
ncbi:hypothetical protein [Pandoravirus japonicus]|uniref:Uncharacterized protein n=1 Tax=Pandoravirus japonicus TaxID=2823154 RepID=A0A811BR24_9VIRU|nr:hypothetical protein [Pandoravirus japonicus]